MSGQELFVADYPSRDTIAEYRKAAKKSKAQRKKAAAVARDDTEMRHRLLAAQGTSATLQVELNVARRTIQEKEAQRHDVEFKLLTERSVSQRTIADLQHRLAIRERQVAGIEAAGFQGERELESRKRATERVHAQFVDSLEAGHERYVATLKEQHSDNVRALSAEHDLAIRDAKAAAKLLGEEVTGLRRELSESAELVARLRRERDDSKTAYKRYKRIVVQGVEERRREVDEAVRQRLLREAPSAEGSVTPSSVWSPTQDDA